MLETGLGAPPTSPAGKSRRGLGWSQVQTVRSGLKLLTDQQVLLQFQIQEILIQVYYLVLLIQWHFQREELLNLQWQMVLLHLLQLMI